jgi:hypothetical protein
MDVSTPFALLNGRYLVSATKGMLKFRGFVSGIPPIDVSTPFTSHYLSFSACSFCMRVMTPLLLQEHGKTASSHSPSLLWAVWMFPIATCKVPLKLIINPVTCLSPALMCACESSSSMHHSSNRLWWTRRRRPFIRALNVGKQGCDGDDDHVCSCWLAPRTTI